jgi:hypothetical protein
MRCRPHRLVGPLAAALLLTACGADGADTPISDAPVEQPGADEPVSSGPLEPDPDPDGGGPELVEPRSGMADVRPRTWEAAEPVEDADDVVRVSFWSGVEPCYVLDRVQVDETDDTVVITLFEGHEPLDGEVACIDLGVYKAVDVELDAPLGDRALVDGAA